MVITVIKGPVDEPIDRIVSAARLCFARLGVRKTSIAEIAQAAGMVRQTVYDYVLNREQLVQLALTARLHELGTGIVNRPELRNASLIEEMTEKLAQMAEAVRDDPECTALFDALSYQNAAQFITAHPAVRNVAILVLAALRERAHREGRLREGLTLEEMGWWTPSALLPLSSRRDLNAKQLRAAVSKFILPAFLKSHDN